MFSVSKEQFGCPQDTYLDSCPEKDNKALEETREQALSGAAEGAGLI